MYSKFSFTIVAIFVLFWGALALPNAPILPRQIQSTSTSADAPTPTPEDLKVIEVFTGTQTASILDVPNEPEETTSPNGLIAAVPPYSFTIVDRVTYTCTSTCCNLIPEYCLTNWPVYASRRIRVWSSRGCRGSSKIITGAVVSFSGSPKSMSRA